MKIFTNTCSWVTFMILKIELFYSAVNTTSNVQHFEEAKYVCSFVIIIDSSLFTFSLSLSLSFSFSFNGSWGCDGAASVSLAGFSRFYFISILTCLPFLLSYDVTHQTKILKHCLGFAAISGLTGLWLGFSVSAFIEWIEFLGILTRKRPCCDGRVNEDGH